MTSPADDETAGEVSGDYDTAVRTLAAAYLSHAPCGEGWLRGILDGPHGSAVRHFAERVLDADQHGIRERLSDRARQTTAHHSAPADLTPAGQAIRASADADEQFARDRRGAGARVRAGRARARSLRDQLGRQEDS